MARKRKAATEAVEVLHRRYFEGKPAQLAELEEERANAAVARRILSLREKAGLSQAALAREVGTTASVICRLEDADYEGHSLTMLRRIAAALDRRVEIRFVPMKPVAKQSRTESTRIAASVARNSSLRPAQRPDRRTVRRK